MKIRRAPLRLDDSCLDDSSSDELLLDELLLDKPCQPAVDKPPAKTPAVAAPVIADRAGRSARAGQQRQSYREQWLEFPATLLRQSEKAMKLRLRLDYGFNGGLAGRIILREEWFPLTCLQPGSTPGSWCAPRWLLERKDLAGATIVS